MFVFVRKPEDIIPYCIISALTTNGGNLINVFYVRKYAMIRFTFNMNLKRHLVPLLILFVNSIAISIYVIESGDLYGMIVSIIKTMPGAPVIMVVVLLTMIAFYAMSFDSIARTASCYSYYTLKDDEQPNDEQPNKGIQLMWCILLILLPIALLFAESSLNNLQLVSIVAAFPTGAVIVMIAVSFMKDAKRYMEELKDKDYKIAIGSSSEV